MSLWTSLDPPTTVWSSGPWTLERRGEELAAITFDGSPVLRSIRAVARDRDWGTVPCTIANVETDSDELVLALRHTGLGADLEGTLRVTATPESLTVRFVTRSLTDFERNRIGLVALHPPTLAGSELVITHASTGSATEIGSATGTGSATEITQFPLAISPHQPAFEIADLAWHLDGVDTTMRFAGDVFEMEDQRNWTDASYKTYSTPLALPFPQLINAGDEIDQSMTIECVRSAPRAGAAAASVIRLDRSERLIPSFTQGASTAPGEAPAGVSPLGDALLVELDARTANWRAAHERARTEAGELPLDVRIVAASAEQVPEVVEALSGDRLVRLGIYSSETHVTEPDLWQALVAATADLDVDLVGGARAHFTELNRTHERLPHDLPSLTFSITPQMHAIETWQILESIAMQRQVATDAAAIATHRPVHIGPVSLRARFNAVATGAPRFDPRTDVDGGYAAEFVPGATDPRQSADEIAAWTIASAAALAVDGVASISYFETWGARGVTDTPTALALAWLHELAGKPLLEVPHPLPENLWILAADTSTGPVALVANLGDDARSIDLEFAGTQTVTVAPRSAARVDLSA